MGEISNFVQAAGNNVGVSQKNLVGVYVYRVSGIRKTILWACLRNYLMA